MNSLFLEGVALLMTKIGVIMASLTMAGLSVVIDARRHTWTSAILSVVCGVTVAVLATDTVVDFLRLPPTAAYGVAGVAGISGQNLIKWVMRVSKDPYALIKLWRGEKDGTEE